MDSNWAIQSIVLQILRPWNRCTNIELVINYDLPEILLIMSTVSAEQVAQENPVKQFHSRQPIRDLTFAILKIDQKTLQ